MALNSYRLYPLQNGNFLLTAKPPGKDGRILPDPDDPNAPAGVIVKHNYWIWNEKNLSGNTIDFFVKIVGMSFNQAIRLCKDTAPGRVEIITNLTAYDLPEQHLRKEREIVPKILR